MSATLTVEPKTAQTATLMDSGPITVNGKSRVSSQEATLGASHWWSQCGWSSSSWTSVRTRPFSRPRKCGSSQSLGHSYRIDSHQASRPPAAAQLVRFAKITPITCNDGLRLLREPVRNTSFLDAACSATPLDIPTFGATTDIGFPK